LRLPPNGCLLVAEVQDCEIVMLGVDGRVATWNAGAQRLKGYEAKAIIGSHLSVFCPDEDVAAGTSGARRRCPSAACGASSRAWPERLRPAVSFDSSLHRVVARSDAAVGGADEVPVDGVARDRLSGGAVAREHEVSMNRGWSALTDVPGTPTNGGYTQNS
jgi:hypothetical protein